MSWTLALRYKVSWRWLEDVWEEKRDKVGKTENGLANKITIIIFIGGFTLFQVLVRVRQVVLLLLLHRWENRGTEMFSHLFRVIQPSRAKFGIQVLQSLLIHCLWRYTFKMCFSLPPTSDNRGCPGTHLLPAPNCLPSPTPVTPRHAAQEASLSFPFLPVVRRLSPGLYLSPPHPFFFKFFFGGQGLMWGHMGSRNRTLRLLLFQLASWE